MVRPMTPASSRTATTAPASWISRRPWLPPVAGPRAIAADVGGGGADGGIDVSSAAGALLPRLYGEPSEPPDHCPIAASSRARRRPPGGPAASTSSKIVAHRAPDEGNARTSHRPHRHLV